MLLAMQASRLLAPAPSRQRLDLHVDLRRDRGAVDEDPALRAGQQAVAALAEYLVHGGIVGDDGDDDVRRRGYSGEGLRGLTIKLAGKRLGQFALNVVDGGNRIALVAQVTRHVRAHPPHAHNTDPLRHVRHR